MTMLTSLIVAAMLCSVNGRRAGFLERHYTAVGDDDVKIDYDVIFNDVTRIQRTLADHSICGMTDNLHDYSTGFLAQKNGYAGICYIKRLDPILDSTYENARADIAAMTEGMSAPMPEYIDMGYDRRPIGPLVLTDIAGDDIAEFCKDMPSYWLFPVPEDQRPEATGVRAKENCTNDTSYQL
ncbi:PREDICTED: uncharacterized protein LOC106815841 [Priapulus caudatus]|uniref:Uncharacterized protein LOC106815841 n=1 Tax=Priapulus caudatus TaxID=37621 RepID=A0ABM1EUH4_PRICU|nr:PREDICTED: uncharacterized protein LOC106815841 [Priapulus caudatus]